MDFWETIGSVAKLGAEVMLDGLTDSSRSAIKSGRFNDEQNEFYERAADMTERASDYLKNLE